MATQRPTYSVSPSDFVATLLSEREVTPRARTAAQHVSELIPGTSVLVYSIKEHPGPSWEIRAIEGEATVDDRNVSVDFGNLGTLWRERSNVVYQSSELTRESYHHLHLRRSIVAIAYFPCISSGQLVGAIEIVSCEAPLTAETLRPVAELVPYVSVALATALSYEEERNSNLTSISRLAQLYDLEKVFSSTLEILELMPIICTKVQHLYEVEAVNLWMVEGEDVLLLERAGSDGTVAMGTRQKNGGGIAADVSETGEPLLIADPADERLTARNAGVEHGGARSLIAAPLIYQENLVGVLEVVNHISGKAFDDDDLFTLIQISEVAASALHNASLLEAERKVEILQTLVEVSQQITSTLNIDRVLEAVVNGPQAVIPFERASIALEDKGKFQIRAVSGLPQVNQSDPDVRRLNELLEWVSGIGQELLVTQHEDEVDADRPETVEKLRKYFKETAARGFYAIPLTDDQGSLGVLAFESSDPNFLTPAHLEMIKVLAGQATVALRNASLYREVPFIGVLEPILQKKQRFMAQSKKRRSMMTAVAVAVIVFLVFFPVPMRLDGDAAVAPSNMARVQPLHDGVVDKIFVREGDSVQRGAVLAEMENWQERASLAGAEAKYQTALSEMNRALASNDGASAGKKRVEADYWAAEVQRDRELLDQTRLLTPIDGLIATAHLENVVGQKFEAGKTILEIIDARKAMIDIGVSERDIALLRPGSRVSVKLEGYPTRTFRGQVAIVSPRTLLDKDERLFFARVEVPNPDGAIRSGMQGRGKISAGWHPAGYVLFRGFFTWVWTKLWNVAGW